MSSVAGRWRKDKATDEVPTDGRSHSIGIALDQVIVLAENVTPELSVIECPPRRGPLKQWNAKLLRATNEFLKGRLSHLHLYVLHLDGLLYQAQRRASAMATVVILRRCTSDASSHLSRSFRTGSSWPATP